MFSGSHGDAGVACDRCGNIRSGHRLPGGAAAALAFRGGSHAAGPHAADGPGARGAVCGNEALQRRSPVSCMVPSGCPGLRTLLVPSCLVCAECLRSGPKG